jgi:hypothetical protein
LTNNSVSGIQESEMEERKEQDGLEMNFLNKEMKSKLMVVHLEFQNNGEDQINAFLEVKRIGIYMFGLLY